MEIFYTFGFIALIAAILKIILLYQVVTASQLTSALNLLIIGLIAQNSFEFLAYLTYANDVVLSSYMIDGVLIANYVVAAAAVQLAMRVSKVHYGDLVSKVFFSTALLLVIFHAMGLVTLGYSKLGYTIISIEGPLYPVFSLYMILAIAVCLGSLCRASKSEFRQVRDRSRVTLIAIAPLCLVGVIVVLCRALGLNASTALVLPVASTLFVWVLMIDERGDYLRFKFKWVILFRLAANADDIKLNNWSSLLERMLIEEAMRVTDNNKSEAARLLGINKTTFHRKAEKYAAESSNSALASTEQQRTIILGETN